MGWARAGGPARLSSLSYRMLGRSPRMISGGSHIFACCGQEGGGAGEGRRERASDMATEPGGNLGGVGGGRVATGAASLLGTERGSRVTSRRPPRRAWLPRCAAGRQGASSLQAKLGLGPIARERRVCRQATARCPRRVSRRRVLGWAACCAFCHRAGGVSAWAGVGGSGNFPASGPAAWGAGGPRPCQPAPFLSSVGPMPIAPRFLALPKASASSNLRTGEGASWRAAMSRDYPQSFRSRACWTACVGH